MESEHDVDSKSLTESDSSAHSSEETRRFVYHFILLSKNGDHVLAEVDANCVAKFPTMELPPGVGHLKPNKEAELGREIEALFGPSVYIVRVLTDEERIEISDCVVMDFLYLGEVLEAKPVVLKPFEWISRDEACTLEWATLDGKGMDENMRTEVKRAFREKNGERLLSNLRPWENMGWFGETTTWCQKFLDRRSMLMAGRIRQRSRTVQSIVMTCEVKKRGKRKLEGNDGSCELIFIKSTILPLREVERTVAVAGVIGNIVPEIIGYEERKGLLMMRNGGRITDEEFDQEALINTILKMQMLSMSRINELEAGGVRVRDSEWVESNVEWILKHEILDKYLESYGDMNEDAKGLVDRTRAKVAQIRKKCRKITELGMPRTLVHGDLYESNVGSPMRIEGKVYRIFDWADSFIGNPLHDFGTLLPWRWGASSEDEEISLDVDAGMEQIRKVWKACGTLTREEMKSVFGTLGEMRAVIQIHDLIEEYESDNKNKELSHGLVVVGQIEEVLDQL